MSLNMASAWRVKYRDMKSKQKIRVRIENMGVHENNRGGVYPAGVRCRDLCIEVLKVEFPKEAFTHALVAVEKKTLHECSKGSEYVFAPEYNKNASQKDGYLMTTCNTSCCRTATLCCSFARS